MKQINNKVRMRDTPFTIKESSFDNDDIQIAFEYNQLEPRLHDIAVIVAEVCGEADGPPWYWILKMKDGTFSWATGTCDYTGWDCRSDAEIHDGYKTPEEAINALNLNEWMNGRTAIKKCLKGQIDGTNPFALYQG